MIKPQPADFSNDFVQMPRIFGRLYLDGTLSYDEKWILNWLWESANPRTGKNKVGYAEIQELSQGRISTNKANKMMLALKRQKLLAFPSQQGRRGSFEVELSYYPYSKGGNTSDHGLFDNPEVLSANVPPNNGGKTSTEVFIPKQKLDSQINGLAQSKSMDQRPSPSRTANNDTDTNTNNNFDRVYKPLNIDTYVPQSYEEKRCIEIAREVGETDPRFVLSVFRRSGLSVLNEAIEIFRNKRGPAIKNLGAYFNAIVESIERQRKLNKEEKGERAQENIDVAQVSNQPSSAIGDDEINIEDIPE